MAAYSDINGFPEAGFPVLSDVSDRVCLNTLYWNPLKEAGFILDVVGDNRLAGNLSLAGMLSGVTSITMNGALSGVSTITANETATLTSSNPLSLTDVNANIRMPGLNSSIGSVLERVYKGYFKNLDVANTLTVNGDDVALIGDIKRYVSGTLNTLPKYNTTGITDSKFTDDGTTPKYNANTIWHAGNDGHNSGLDADTIDTYQGSSIMASKRQLVNNENLDNLKEIGSYVNATGNGSGNSNFPTNYGIIDISGDGGPYGGIQRSYDAGNGDLSYRMNWGGWQPWRKVWNDKNSNLPTVDWAANNLNISNTISFNGTFRKRGTLERPANNAGSGKWYIRLHPVGQGRLVSFKITVNGTFHYAPVMGYLSAEYSYYSATNNTLNNQSFVVKSTTGEAAQNLRLGNTVIENGYVSIPVWCSNTNPIFYDIEISVGGDTEMVNNITSTPWMSDAMPSLNKQSINNGLDINGNLNITGNATIGTLTGSVVANNGILSVVPGGNSAISPTYTVNDWDGFLTAVAMCNDTTGGKVKGGRIQCGYSIINLPTQDYTELDLSNIYITGGVFRVTVEPLRIKSTCNFEYTTFLYDNVTTGSLIVLSAPENGGSVVYFNDCVFSGITPSSQYDNLAYHILIDSINQKAFALYFNNCRTSTTSPTNYAGLRVITRAVQDLYISVKGLGLPISGLYGISNSPQTITVFGTQPTRYTTFSLDSTVTLYTPFQNSAYSYVSVNKTRITDIIDPLNVYNDATIYNNLTVNGTTNITRPTTTLTFSESGKWGDFSSIVVQGRREGKTNVIFMSFYSANASSGTDRILGRITNYISPGYDVMVNVNTPSGLSENATGYIDTNGYIILRIGKGGVTYNAQATWITP